MTNTKLDHATPRAGRLGARAHLAASALALSAAALAAPACVADPDAGAGADTAADTAAADTATAAAGDPRAAALQWSGEGTEVASVLTAAGTTVTFLATADDELGVALVGTIGRIDDELDRAQQTAGGDPVRLFELLAGKPAPQALVDAAARVARGAYTVDASDDGEVEIPGPTGATLLPAPAVPSNFCNIYNWAYSGSNAFKYCWPDQYGTPIVKKKADHLSCRIDSVSGPQRARYRYKSGLTWHTPLDLWLSSGQYLQYTGNYQWAQRWRECRTVENPSSRRHHFRVVGHEWLSGLGFNPVSVSFPSP